VPVKDLCRKHGFSDATFYKWRSRLGGPAEFGEDLY
jgi:putative transposase